MRRSDSSTARPLALGQEELDAVTGGTGPGLQPGPLSGISPLATLSGLPVGPGSGMDPNILAFGGTPGLLLPGEGGGTAGFGGQLPGPPLPPPMPPLPQEGGQAGPTSWTGKAGDGPPVNPGGTGTNLPTFTGGIGAPLPPGGLIPPGPFGNTGVIGGTSGLTGGPPGFVPSPGGTMAGGGTATGFFAHEPDFRGGVTIPNAGIQGGGSAES